MHFFALDEERPVSAPSAFKHKDYRCPECNHPVRVRSGPHRQPHFYHVASPSTCSQHEKSVEHLQTQLMLSNLLPPGESSMECPFPEINRIADLAWHPQKIVFEVQCSPISQEEARQRCLDYRSVGYEVVWILHEKTFNKRRLSEAESYLRHQICYFTNMSPSGQGVIYDQFEVCTPTQRLFKGVSLSIDPKQPHTFPTTQPNGLPKILSERTLSHSLFFSGDLFHRWLNDPEKTATARTFTKIEKSFEHQQKLSWLYIKNLYKHLLNHLLRATEK